MTEARPIVAGGGIYPFGRHTDGSNWRDWVRQAGREALADSALAPQDIDAVVVASETDFLSLQVNPGPVVLAELGLTGRPVMRVEGGGASGGLAIREAMTQILAGISRCVLVVGFDAAAGHLSAPDVQLVYGLSFDAETEGMGGGTAVLLYALSMLEHMARYGTTREAMACVAVRNRANAIGNPNAHKPMRLSRDDVLSSPVIADPYRKFDCSLASDGAAAIVLTAGDMPTRADRPRIAVTGSGVGTDLPRLGDRQHRCTFLAKRRAADAAYKMAQIANPRDEIDVAEIYDAFTGAELQSLEALRFVPDGEAGPSTQNGEFGPDSDLPVNLSGGLLGQGGVPGATGIAQAVNMARLLSGTYHQQMSEPPRRGLIDVHGGICTISAVHILERLPA